MRSNERRACRIATLLLALLPVACSEAVPTNDASASPVQRGLSLVEAKACTACHALDGARGIGPSWVGIYGTTRTFADGSSAPVDDAYLRRSMLEPGAQVVAGFDSVMVPAAVTDAELADIIALIKELRDGALP